MQLTPVHRYSDWWAKRDDLALFTDGRHASGSKMRQYMQMVEMTPDVPLIVGCSAFAAQQIYVADAAERTGREGIVFVPARREQSLATGWARKHGAKIIEVRPGYPSVYKKRARDYAVSIGGAVRWQHPMAIQDTVDQCQNVPRGVRRIIVPTASGLVTTGILIGLAGRDIEVVAICVSGLAKLEKIHATAAKWAAGRTLPRLRGLRLTMKYETPVDGWLPDGTRLDSYYAAKALPFVGSGDLLWITGCRPWDAMPECCKPQRFAFTRESVEAVTSPAPL
jgi:hypothetical protein